MPKNHRSNALAAIHETAADLRRVGGMAQETRRKFDALCLTPIQEITPQKDSRSQNSREPARRYSPPTSTSRRALLSKWERREKHPQGASLKLLSLVDKKGLEVVA